MKKGILSCIGLVILLSGCTTQRQNSKIHPLCMAEPSSIVITQVSGLEKPGLYKTGNQGLLDLAISNIVTSSVSEKIESIDARPIVERNYYGPFENVFANQSFKVIKDNTPMSTEGMTTLEDAKLSPYDFSSLKSKHGAKYALVLQPNHFGAQRSYYGFIPTSAPAGLADITVYLVKLDDNSIAGYFNTTVTEAVKGDWDVPPHYSALTAASNKALTKALNNAYRYLLSNIPQAAISSADLT